MKRSLILVGIATTLVSLPARAQTEPTVSQDKPPTASLALTYQQQLLAKAPRSIPTYPVSVSSPNRIAVADSRIINIVYDQNQLEVELDKTSGEAFVIPISGNAITVFVMSENKETHSLTLIPQNILSQNIELKSKRPDVSFAPRPMSPNPILKAGDFDSSMKNLMVTMARGELPEGFDLFESEKPVARDEKSDRWVLIKRYVGASVIGEELRYRHRGTAPIVLQETFFTEPDILAVAIVRRELKPGESTRVFRILKRSR